MWCASNPDLSGLSARSLDAIASFAPPRGEPAAAAADQLGVAATRLVWRQRGARGRLSRWQDTFANRWLLTYSHHRRLCGAQLAVRRARQRAGADAAVVLHRRLDALISAQLLRYTRNTRAERLQSRPDPSGSAAAAAALCARRCAVRPKPPERHRRFA